MRKHGVAPNWALNSNKGHAHGQTATATHDALQVLSGLLTLALLGGLGYLYFMKSGGGGDNDDDDKRKSSSSEDDASGDGSPLSDARRIMDKYK